MINNMHRVKKFAQYECYKYEKMFHNAKDDYCLNHEKR